MGKEKSALVSYISCQEMNYHQHAACGNQILTINHSLQDCPQWKESRKKYNIQGNIGTLLGKNCEVEKMMRFLKETEMFEKI